VWVASAVIGQVVSRLPAIRIGGFNITIAVRLYKAWLALSPSPSKERGIKGVRLINKNP